MLTHPARGQVFDPSSTVKRMQKLVSKKLVRCYPPLSGRVEWVVSNGIALSHPVHRSSFGSRRLRKPSSRQSWYCSPHLPLSFLMSPVLPLSLESLALASSCRCLLPPRQVEVVKAEDQKRKCASGPAGAQPGAANMEVRDPSTDMDLPSNTMA